MRTYSRDDCPICGRMITRSGLGRTQHFRVHVREGTMTERVVRLDKHPYEEHYFDVVKDKQPEIGHSATGRSVRLVRTAAEIAAEIQALKAVRPQVRRHSFFGDDNRSKVGAEIEVLERLREPTLDGPEDVEEFERTLEIPGQTAWDWLTRVTADRPSKDWAALLPETETPESDMVSASR